MSQQDSDFEDYRRGRKRWSHGNGPKRDLGNRAGVLRELEAVEEREIRNEQISREVNEFFTDATRTAAEIVAKVSGVQEEQRLQNIGADMVDFINSTMERVQVMIEGINARSSGGPQLAMTDLEPQIRNIVGAQLDEFRYEGTARVADKHIGQDPFHAPGTQSPPVEEPEHELPAIEIDDHLVAEVAAEEEVVEPEVANGVFDTWVDLLRNDPHRLAATLKILVAGREMTKNAALAIFREMTDDADA